ncbi:MAG: PD-(D/E)XK nuclease family protein [Clostridia bacterium]|nr:PD-(D/E)XK nuclease family protein [Clostridia bacterium]
MTERRICQEFSGSFDTDVYSFGNYLRLKKPFDKLLSKEGSSMAVKRVLANLPLKRFSASRTNLAPSLYELIAQLKSAKISVTDLETASINSQGLLKDKLYDIVSIYSAYENFLEENEYDDQNSSFSYLPKIIENDIEIKNSNVYVIGFSGFTAQLKSAIKKLITCAHSVTAILVRGENRFAFVNETSDDFIDICASVNEKLTTLVVNSDYSEEGRVISQTLFNPSGYKKRKIETEKVLCSSFPNAFSELSNVSGLIYTLIKNGDCRFKDVCVAVPDPAKYKDAIKSAFSMLNIPYFLDCKKIPLNHPLVTLIISYIDVFRRNFEQSSLRDFYKNPLVSTDKKLTDSFENYILKYNVNYSAFKKPFKFADDGENLTELENFRTYVCSLIEKFNINELLERLSVEEKLQAHTETLNSVGETLTGSLNSQIFDAVSGVLSEMQSILGATEVTYSEFKAVFISGISALELSVIPQYNDAVFIGAYKEIGLVKCKHLFCVGLTSEVPQAKEDVALLSDSDINALSEIKILVEPKIRVVNHRMRESVALALSAFSEKLYLTYPITGIDGKQNVKSEILSYMQSMFTLKPFPEISDYLTKKQGLNSFAKHCSDFCEGRKDDFTVPASFYNAVEEASVKKILDSANKQVKLRLNSNSRAVTGDIASPTAIEDYYKCPYRSFMVHGLKLKERKQGKNDSLSVGNFMHEVLNSFVNQIDKVYDEKSSDRLFEEILTEINKKQEFALLMDDPETANSYLRVVKECKKFCYKTFEYFKDSDFKSTYTEVGFGKINGAKYPEISLNGGKVKLSGKIDRVDTYKDYCRVIDYKTGSVDPSDKSLFAGVKLQLYLYAAAINDKKLAGAYYLPISDAFEKTGKKQAPITVGKTLMNKETLLAQDKTLVEGEKSAFTGVSYKGEEVLKATSESKMNSLIEYALMLSENGVKQMVDGVIVPSPYGNVCDYCKFVAMCKRDLVTVREICSVDEEVIEQSVKGEKECPN